MLKFVESGDRYKVFEMSLYPILWFSSSLYKSHKTYMDGVQLSAGNHLRLKPFECVYNLPVFTLRSLECPAVL